MNTDSFSCLTTRAEGGKPWGGVLNISKAVTRKVCGLMDGSGGRTKARPWTSSEGRVLIRRQNWGCPSVVPATGGPA